MEDPSELICLVCGYFCLGNGGLGCIDKKVLYMLYCEKMREKSEAIND
jgi:hypothetical protein